MSEYSIMQDLATALGEIVVPAGLPAIKKIFTNPTFEVPSTNTVPCIVIFRRKPSNVSMITFGVERNENEFVCQFIYNPVGQDTTQINYPNIVQYLDAIHTALYQHYQLYNAGDNGVMYSLPKVDGNPGLLKEKWGGQGFVGCDILVRVAETRKITLGV